MAQLCSKRVARPSRGDTRLAGVLDRHDSHAVTLVLAGAEVRGVDPGTPKRGVLDDEKASSDDFNVVSTATIEFESLPP